VGLALCHAEEENDPWLIYTDQEAGYSTVRTYSRRMWIEQLFADLEDGDFHLNRSRIYRLGPALSAGHGTVVDVRLAFARRVGWSNGDSSRRSTGLTAEIEATWSWADAGFSGV